ncbi:MAG: Hsp20/alpha crystallin family protein [Chitinophagales bacterium]|jgi:HSP20 family protein|nr:Hsp20/alpha crystallin family protein [Chitinophagales bacterium]HNL08575.1 Hsp20/alpha crystallin family protein [Chitinophagales bacterium]
MANFSELFDDFINKGMKDLNQSIKTVISKVENNTNKNAASASVNIVETGNSYRVEIAAPGFAKENFRLSIDNGIITIKGEKIMNQQNNTEQYLRQEFSVENFERSFNLPKAVDTNKIDASYREGILFVTLGKKDEFIQQSGININIQ